jgi:hypothetical protein
MDDVGAERLLHLDGDLGRKKMRRAVDGRTELDAGLGDLSELREAEHLEAAGVGEDRPVPAHEAMQSAELTHEAVPRPQKQVIGVGEHDLGAGGAEVVGPERLHRGVRADGHEDRRLDHPVGSRQTARARGAVGRSQLELHRIKVASPYE